MNSEEKQIILPISGMTCANCVATIERNLNKLDGVSQSSVNLSTERATVSFDPLKLSLSGIVTKIQSAGYDVSFANLEFHVSGLSDSNDALRLESVLLSTEGVTRAEVNLASQHVHVNYIPTIINYAEISNIIKRAGFTAINLSDTTIDAEETARTAEIAHQKKLLITGLALTIPLFVLSMARDFNFLPMQVAHSFWLDLLMLALATPVQFYVGWQFYIGAFKALQNKTANMDVLIALGSSAAYLYSLPIVFRMLEGHHYLETAAVIITLIRLGKFLETRAKGRTGQAIRKLLNLKPKHALLIKNGIEQEVPVDDVQLGDEIIVKPGVSIPVDGIILEGNSSIDESMLTGESMPVDKNPGDTVYAATLNKLGLIRFKATRVGKETALSQIIKLVEEAQGSKAPIQHLADKVASIFVPIVILIAILTFIMWLFLPIGLPDNTTVFTRAMINAVAVLVIACPCALGLATPTAIMVASGKGAEMGILFRSGEAIESGAQLQTIVFDKTGTITRGQPVLNQIILVDDSFTESEILRLAASLEKGSEHPLGEALIAEAGNRNLILSSPEKFKAYSGLGIKGIVEGHNILLGNLRFMESETIHLETAKPNFETLEKEANTAVLVAVNLKLIAIFGIFDPIKDGSREAIQDLHKMQLKTVMLTGDNKITAHTIAEAAGIDEVVAEVLPGEKTDVIKNLQQKGNKIAMIGDGINDAPSLAQADLGMAIGTGTDVAIAAAPVTLVSGDLRNVPRAVRLSRKAMLTIKQNLFWAFIYNIILIPIAAAGLLNPMLAAGAMAFSSVFVVSNSLRLRRANI